MQHLSASPTPLANSTLLPLLLLSLARQKHTPDTSTRIRKEYDYIVVGGGTAGSVLAGRLSELPCVSVLLLEAGRAPPPLTEVPALGRYFRGDPDLDWRHRTVPQKYTGRALIDRRVPWPSGKMLGGSSSFGTTLYVRGNRKNYDDWAEQGAEGWSYKEVYPYFLKLENNQDRDFLANGYHTTGGPVTVHAPKYEPEWSESVFRAARGMGYRDLDSNARTQTGFFEPQAALRDGQRCGTPKAYLVPAENRTNLDILTEARVTKVLFDGRRARGVLFDHGARGHVVSARREVVLSAGTVNTAQLLMLSGIGPARELRRLKIPPLVDLPVGRNLQDHGGAAITFSLGPRVPRIEERLSDPASIAQYVRNRTGPLSSADGVGYLAFLRGQAIYPPDDFPNYQLYFAETSAESERRRAGLKPQVFKKLYGPYRRSALLSCTVSLLQPRSRGEVTLRSSDPYDPPLIDPRYLEDHRDLEDIVQGMKTCARIGSRMGVRPLKTLVPGCERYAGNEDLYFGCQARSVFVSLHHYIGTARMGRPDDPRSVVDPRLRVKHVRGLRVVDASVMPIIPSGDTLVPTIMIAERAAEMIKETIRCHRMDDDDASSRLEEDTKMWHKSRELSWEEEYVERNRPDDQLHPWTEEECPDDHRHQITSWSDDEDISTDDNSLLHDDRSKPRDREYLPRDYWRDPDTESEEEGHWKPYSWYKRQTDRILDEIRSGYFHTPLPGPSADFDELVRLPAERTPEGRPPVPWNVWK